MAEGIIIKINNGIYTVKYDGGILECKIKGKLRSAGLKPITGDNCSFEIKDSIITDILPRKNSFIRPKLANVDNMIVVFAGANPEPQPGVIDRLTVTAEQKGIKPIIVITKADIASKEIIEKYEKIYKSAGYDVIVTSRDNTDELPGELIKSFKGKITAVAGCSGVGKSTFLNKLFGGSNLKTGEISSKNLKGRHTTTCIELFEKFGGLIADTPGFSSLEIFDAEKEDIEKYFPEIKKNLYGCRFVGCSHISEPDCAVKNALENNKIHPLRYESYVNLYTEIKNRKKY